MFLVISESIKIPLLFASVDSLGFSLWLHANSSVPIIAVEFLTNYLFLNCKTHQFTGPVSHSVSVLCPDHRDAYGF